MENKFIIPCGGLKAEDGSKGARILPLVIKKWQSNGNVNLELENLHKALFKAVPSEYVDLLEIATYVITADQATSRGQKDVDEFGGQWRRHFDFRIPVRNVEFWNQPKVVNALRDMLEFLSEDYFDFSFVHGENAPGMQEYFPNLIEGSPNGKTERVVLFSGGLDSLAGAIDEAVVNKRRVMLVTHRPTDKMNNVHRKLQELLARKAGDRYRPMHLYVTINKDRRLNKNYTQRSRSFLYAAIGATVAKMQDLDSLRFYENGVVSINLPVSAQVVGSKATRTTHPQTLAGFQKLLRLVAGNELFKVENDFIWDTKADVIKRIIEAGCGEMIASSVSCAHTFSYSTKHPHCGICSQCIDRRLGMVAAEAEELDPADGYATDVFTGERPKEEDKMMLSSYLRRADKIAGLRDAADMLVKFPEVLKALKYLPGNPEAMTDKLLKLHRSHASEVKRAIERMGDLILKLPEKPAMADDCLLKIAKESSEAVALVPMEGESTQRQEARWVEQKADPNTYRLWRGYKAWRLVFQGEEEVLQNERAVHLIEYLLKNPPDEAIHATELERRVDGNPVTDGTGGIEREKYSGDDDGDVGGVIQEASGKKLGAGTGKLLRQEMAELLEDSEDMTLSPEAREVAKGKLEELASAQGRGGKMLGAADRAAERVRKAIRRFIDDLKETERVKGVPHTMLRTFATHLEQHLWLPSVGGIGRAGASGKPGCFIYEAPNGVIWKD